MKKNLTRECAKRMYQEVRRERKKSSGQSGEIIVVNFPLLRKHDVQNVSDRGENLSLSDGQVIFLESARQKEPVE